MKYIATVFLLGLGINSFGQKALITDKSYLTWTSVTEGGISSEGNYVFYNIQNTPIGSNTITIKSTSKNWEIKLSGHGHPLFSSNEKFLFTQSGDTLFQWNLSTRKAIKTTNCRSYQLLGEGKFECLVYQISTPEKTVYVNNLAKLKTYTFSNVSQIIPNKSGHTVLLKVKTSNHPNTELYSVNLEDCKSKMIYSGFDPAYPIFDNSGNRMAFTTGKPESNSIWYFDNEMKSAKEMVHDKNIGIEPGFKIQTDGLWRFSNDGHYLFFTQNKPVIKSMVAESPTIWSYQDAFLKSRYQQISTDLDKESNVTVLDILSGKVKKLLHGRDKIQDQFFLSMNDILIVQTLFGDGIVKETDSSRNLKYYLYSIKTGNVTDIDVADSTPTKFYLSPDNAYLFYYVNRVGKYYSYSIANKVKRMIGEGIPDLGIHNIDRRDANAMPSSIIGWIKENNHAMIQGEYDLWDVDLSGKEKPTNLTKGLGIKNGIIFTLAEYPKNRIISAGDNILIIGFNNFTKKNIIYRLRIDKKEFAPIHSTANKCYSLPYEKLESPSFYKSKDGKKYILKTETASRSANYFFSSNFKSLIPLSANQPERQYNWLKSELVNYKDKHDNKCQGVLYTPENLDLKKRYPVIFYYYNEMANGVNRYISPDPSTIGVNIPLLVSNGYIVFTPNLYSEIGNPGESKLRSIEAATDYLAKLSWIDTTKMGIIGHSLGGDATNYFITHSKRYAAAVSEAGGSNMLQAYNAIWKDAGESQQSYYRAVGFDGNPSLLFENSAVAHVKDVFTPLLLMHNEEDHIVSVSQSTQFFIQLRSLQKPVWLLQYSEEGHVISEEGHQLDFQSKVKGFFDHYLKDEPMPTWMNNPIK